MELLDGTRLAKKLKEQIKQEVKILQKKQNITPGLGVILVGNDSASAAYVNMKSKACKEAGIYSVVHEMPESISQEDILKTISFMNNDANLDGILVQLPLPKQINTSLLLEAIKPCKDVDGFHPFNVGRLVCGLDGFIPATALGVMELLKEYKISLKGKDACIVGASNIVGKPLASLFLNENASVDICHVFTKDLKAHTLRADIVCVATGVAKLIKEDMIKENCIIIDIGMNKLDDGSMCGDADFENLCKKCSFITPVPKGVGPMTIASLLKNTLKAAKQRNNNNDNNASKDKK